MNVTGRSVVFAHRLKESGFYVLSGDTYGYREIIAKNGGIYRGDTKTWTVAKEVVGMIHASIQVRVRVAAHCHCPEEEIVINKEIAEQGFVNLGCSRCDRSIYNGERVKVLEIIGEEERDG